jgi:hypothetical protein
MQAMDSGPSCSAVHGAGPAGALCGMCSQLGAAHEPRDGGRVVTVFFCGLDGSRRRATAAACARFVEASATPQERAT